MYVRVCVCLYACKQTYTLTHVGSSLEDRLACKHCVALLSFNRWMDSCKITPTTPTRPDTTRCTAGSTRLLRIHVKLACRFVACCAALFLSRPRFELSRIGAFLYFPTSPAVWPIYIQWYRLFSSTSRAQVYNKL